MLLYSLLVTLHWDADGYRQLTVVVMPVKTRPKNRTQWVDQTLESLSWGEAYKSYLFSKSQNLKSAGYFCFLVCAFGSISGCHSDLGIIFCWVLKMRSILCITFSQKKVLYNH